MPAPVKVTELAVPTTPAAPPVPPPPLDAEVTDTA
jgi:hypothetical protein